MISFALRVSALLLCLHTARAADWPQWRGPDRTGHAPAGAAVPGKIPAEPKSLWRVPVGDGLASPVMSGGKVVYLDNQQGRETVHAVAADTGKILWSAPLDDTFKDSQSTPGPRCTPLVNDGRVYAQSCRGELKCLDLRDGRLLWRVNYVTNFGAVFIGEKGTAAGAVRHGYDGSPLIDGAHLITVAGGTNGEAVVCLDKQTGKPVWRSQSDVPAYAPPILATVAGQRQVIAFTVDGLIGLDPVGGKLFWRVPFKTTYGRHVTTPVVSGDVVAISSHQFGLVGARVTRAGREFSATPAWTNKEAAINFSSPVIVDGFLYGVGPAKNLVCVEMGTGRTAWTKSGYINTSADKAHASFIVMGKNILVLTDGGQLVLIAADSKECRELGRAQVSGNTWCNPAYADGKLWLRDAKELLCVDLMGN